MSQQHETSFRTSGVFQREEAFLRAQREAERKRQERELLHIQEEQERLQRKKVPESHSPHLHGYCGSRVTHRIKSILDFAEQH